MLAAAQAVRLQPVGAILDHLFQEADAFAAGAPQHDDMTLLILRLTLCDTLITKHNEPKMSSNPWDQMPSNRDNIEP